MRSSNTGPAVAVTNSHIENTIGTCRYEALRTPLSSEYGTYKTVTARLWPSFPGKRPLNL